MKAAWLAIAEHATFVTIKCWGYHKQCMLHMAPLCIAVPTALMYHSKNDKGQQLAAAQSWDAAQATRTPAATNCYCALQSQAR
jgi:hypothetical protein